MTRRASSTRISRLHRNPSRRRPWLMRASMTGGSSGSGVAATTEVTDRGHDLADHDTDHENGHRQEPEEPADVLLAAGIAGFVALGIADRAERRRQVQHQEAHGHEQDDVEDPPAPGRQ